MTGNMAHAAPAGTEGYRAPELLPGRMPTIASDLYATGVILRDMVSGAADKGGAAKGDWLDEIISFSIFVGDPYRGSRN